MTRKLIKTYKGKLSKVTAQIKAEAEEANAQQEVLAKAPLPIYIG